MSKVTLSILTAVSVVALFELTASVGAQSSAGFEYMRGAAYTVSEESIVRGERTTLQKTVYRACKAAELEWSCQILPGESENASLRSMLTRLGAEGWELVSVVKDDDKAYGGPTYLFKRPAK